MSYFRRRTGIVAGVVSAFAIALSLGVAAPSPASAPGVFTHPGVVLGRAQLDLMRTAVNAGSQPWAAAFDDMRSSKFASLKRKIRPRATVECGSYSKPDRGCTDEREDAIAAYTDALVWYVSGDVRYAQKSVEIMDAWSATLRSHTNSNAPLQSAWAASSWAKAAEIMRYSYAEWPADRVDRFSTLLRDVYLPELFVDRATFNGNWELGMMEAAVGISVFIEDPVSYDRAVSTFRNRVPAYIYLRADGEYPRPPANTKINTPDEIVKYWDGQSTFVDGLSQETCRDFAHTGYGLSAIGHIAETTRLQGQDVYPEIEERLSRALELHARYELGERMPAEICDGRRQRDLGPTTEVLLNALRNRRGVPLPATQALTERERPAGTNHLFVAWETLTNAGG